MDNSSETVGLETESQKLECEKFTHQEEIVNEKVCTEKLITRDSLRANRLRTRSTTQCLNTTQLKEVVIEPVPQPIIPVKSRKQWEQWSEEDQECFFQGLSEYGKDYAKIQLYMKKKRKLKSNIDAKSSEQIRYFYHRSWAKISKTLHIPNEPDPKKSFRREMHYMICLGELRKKGVHGLGQKVAKQLCELVTQGFTNVRYKGRNVRVRSPNRFLKKLYRNKDNDPDIVFPKYVTIEFLPNCNSAFNYVQKFAFNPRLRFSNVSINAKFSDVFDMFDRRFSDLYANENLKLLVYPSYSNNMTTSLFSEKLSGAKDFLEHQERKSESPIILEDASKNPENPLIETIQCEEFPKLFGSNQQTEEEKSRVPVDPFEGFWTYKSAEKVHIKTLFVATGQKQLIKLKYEWDLFEEKKPSFYVDSLKFLTVMAKSEVEKRTQKVKPKANVNPQIHYQPINVPQKIPAVITNTKNRLCVVNRNQFAIPFRPRPGRKRTHSSVNMQATRNRTLMPRVNTNNILYNTASVNTQANNVMVPPRIDIESMEQSHELNAIPSKMYDIATVNQSVLHPYQEVVLEEGCNNEHFRSLTDFLSSSTLQTTELHHSKYDISHLLKTPTKINSSSNNTVPSSPNLDWLQTSAPDVSLSESSFLSVCEMQAFQQKAAAQEILLKVDANKDSDSLNRHKDGHVHEKDGHNPTNCISDPTLPMFHTGESSHGPLHGLSFELSNQGELI